MFNFFLPEHSLGRKIGGALCAPPQSFMFGKKCRPLRVKVHPQEISIPQRGNSASGLYAGSNVYDRELNFLFKPSVLCQSNPQMQADVFDILHVYFLLYIHVLKLYFLERGGLNP